MNILALVPACSSARRASRYSFLAEELRQLSQSGPAIHAISRFVDETTVRDGVTLHPLPKIRALPHTARSLRWRRHLHRSHRLVHRLKVARTLQRVYEVCLTNGIDVIYSPFAWPACTAGSPVAQALGIPLVISLRGVDILVEESLGYGHMLNEADRHMMTTALESASHVIGVSRALVEAGIAFGASRTKTSIILKGVDTHRFAPGSTSEARAALSLGDRPTILFVGGLARYKGIHLLLAAFSRVLETVPSAQLVVCGVGGERPQIAARIAHERWDDRVILTGRVARSLIPTYFNACDVLVLPSLTEGSGNVLVEAGACGKPVIGTDHAGIPDYIDNAVTGLLFRKSDTADLADKLTWLLTNEQRAKEMGEAGRKRVEDKHQYPQMIDSILSVLRRAVDSPGARNA